MRRIRLAVLGGVLSLAVAAPVAGAQPEFSREVVDARFQDPFLSEICGFPVTVSVSGHTILRSWLDADGNPVRDVFTIRVHGSFSAGGQTLRFTDAGMDTATFLGGGGIQIGIHGNLGLVTAKGHGPILGATGRIVFTDVPVLDENGNPVLDENGDPTFVFSVLADSGLRVEDFVTFCAVLAPPA